MKRRVPASGYHDVKMADTKTYFAHVYARGQGRSYFVGSFATALEAAVARERFIVREKLAAMPNFAKGLPKGVNPKRLGKGTSRVVSQVKDGRWRAILPRPGGHVVKFFGSEEAARAARKKAEEAMGR
jgi:hypothetical protein